MLPEPLLEKLRAAQTDRRLVAYRKWNDAPDIFLVGFILDIEAEHIVFDEVGTSGRMDDEQERVSIAHIVGFDFETDYLKGLETLVPVYAELIGAKPTAGIRASSTKSIESNLKVAARTGEAVTLEMKDGKFSVIIQQVDGEYFSYVPIVEGGAPDGLFWLRLDVVKTLKRKTDRQIADRYLYDQHLVSQTKADSE